MIKISLRDLTQRYKFHYARYRGTGNQDDFMIAKAVYALYTVLGGTATHTELESSNDLLSYKFMFKCLLRVGESSSKEIYGCSKIVIKTLEEELNKVVALKGYNTKVVLKISASKQTNFSVIQVRVTNYKFVNGEFACSITSNINSLKGLIESCTNCLVGAMYNMKLSNEEYYFKSIYALVQEFSII